MKQVEVGAAQHGAVVEELLARLAGMGLVLRGSVFVASKTSETESLASLRQVLPGRAVTSNEAEVLAERLARKLRSQMECLGPVLSEKQVAAMPWIAEIEHVSDLPNSGMSNRLPDGRWVVSLNADETELRRRFSMAHELCHTLIDELGETLLPSQRFATHDERLERFCDRFAGALLMPRMLLRADWVDGIQCVDLLSRRYRVSCPAVRVRLRQLGLTEPLERCGRPQLKARRR